MVVDARIGFYRIRFCEIIKKNLCYHKNYDFDITKSVWFWYHKTRFCEITTCAYQLCDIKTFIQLLFVSFLWHHTSCFAIYRDYYMTFFSSRADMGRGLIWCMVQKKKCHIIIYLSYIFSSLLAHFHLLTFSILLSRNNESTAVTAIDIDKKKRKKKKKKKKSYLSQNNTINVYKQKEQYKS